MWIAKLQENHGIIIVDKTSYRRCCIFGVRIQYSGLQRIVASGYTHAHHIGEVNRIGFSGT